MYHFDNLKMIELSELMTLKLIYFTLNVNI